MVDQSSLRAERDLVLALPTAADLTELRAKVKRAKAPKLLVGADWSNSIVGRISTTSGDDGTIVEWQMVGGPKRSLPFAALSEDPALETERLELGWMIANMARLEGARMLRMIPGPREAMAEASRYYYREEERWRCWALWGPNPPPRRARTK